VTTYEITIDLQSKVSIDTKIKIIKRESKNIMCSGGARKNIGGGPAKYTLIYKT